jgi:hypothetical protein
MVFYCDVIHLVASMGLVTCRVRKYGPVFKSNIFGEDVIVVADMAGLKKVLYHALNVATPQYIKIRISQLT